MGQHVCPVWVGYLLLSPLRRLLENPRKLLGPLVSPGMTVLEPGCGMGYFTLPLAEMVGPEGKVVVVDIQEKMLAKVRSRAGKAGLASRIETRLASGQGLGVEDLNGQVDFAMAMHVVHELKAPEAFIRDVFAALRPGGRFLVAEPRGHVSAGDFARSLDLARGIGFGEDPQTPRRGLRAVLMKPERSGE